jgi:hypothetical protein
MEGFEGFVKRDFAFPIFDSFNGLAQAQRRGEQDSFAIILHFYQAKCVPATAQPLSPGADVRRSLRLFLITRYRECI